MRAARTTTRCQPNGPRCLVAYRGPSNFDGSTIRAALYSLHGGSLNRKIGRMAQLLIAPDDAPPHRAVSSGRDAAVCGNCPLRPSAGGGCYTIPPLYLPQVWLSTNGLDANLGAACDALRKSGLPLRFGSWGDPAAVPFEVLEHLAHATADDDGVPRITAYSSAWRTCDPRLRDLAMAEHERAEAKGMGWRSFRVRTPSMPLLPGEIVCPATPEPLHIQPRTGWSTPASTARTTDAAVAMRSRSSCRPRTRRSSCTSGTLTLVVTRSSSATFSMPWTRMPIR